MSNLDPLKNETNALFRFDSFSLRLLSNANTFTLFVAELPTVVASFAELNIVGQTINIAGDPIEGIEITIVSDFLTSSPITVVSGTNGVFNIDAVVRELFHPEISTLEIRNVFNQVIASFPLSSLEPTPATPLTISAPLELTENVTYNITGTNTPFDNVTLTTTGLGGLLNGDIIPTDAAGNWETTIRVPLDSGLTSWTITASSSLGNSITNGTVVAWDGIYTPTIVNNPDYINAWTINTGTSPPNQWNIIEVLQGTTIITVITALADDDGDFSFPLSADIIDRSFNGQTLTFNFTEQLSNTTASVNKLLPSVIDVATSVTIVSTNIRSGNRNDTDQIVTISYTLAEAKEFIETITVGGLNIPGSPDIITGNGSTLSKDITIPIEFNGTIEITYTPTSPDFGFLVASDTATVLQGLELDNINNPIDISTTNVLIEGYAPTGETVEVTAFGQTLSDVASSDRFSISFPITYNQKKTGTNVNASVLSIPHNHTITIPGVIPAFPANFTTLRTNDNHLLSGIAVPGSSITIDYDIDGNMFTVNATADGVGLWESSTTLSWYPTGNFIITVTDPNEGSVVFTGTHVPKITPNINNLSAVQGSIAQSFNIRASENTSIVLNADDPNYSSTATTDGLGNTIINVAEVPLTTNTPQTISGIITDLQTNETASFSLDIQPRVPITIDNIDAGGGELANVIYTNSTYNFGGNIPANGVASISGDRPINNLEITAVNPNDTYSATITTDTEKTIIVTVSTVLQPTKSTTFKVVDDFQMSIPLSLDPDVSFNIDITSPTPNRDFTLTISGGTEFIETNYTTDGAGNLTIPQTVTNVAGEVVTFTLSTDFHTYQSQNRTFSGNTADNTPPVDPNAPPAEPSGLDLFEGNLLFFGRVGANNAFIPNLYIQASRTNYVRLTGAVSTSPSVVNNDLSLDEYLEIEKSSIWLSNLGGSKSLTIIGSVNLWANSGLTLFMDIVAGASITLLEIPPESSVVTMNSSGVISVDYRGNNGQSFTVDIKTSYTFAFVIRDEGLDIYEAGVFVGTATAGTTTSYNLGNADILISPTSAQSIAIYNIPFTQTQTEGFYEDIPTGKRRKAYRILQPYDVIPHCRLMFAPVDNGSGGYNYLWTGVNTSGINPLPQISPITVTTDTGVVIDSPDKAGLNEMTFDGISQSLNASISNIASPTGDAVFFVGRINNFSDTGDHLLFMRNTSDRMYFIIYNNSRLYLYQGVSSTAATITVATTTLPIVGVDFTQITEITFLSSTLLINGQIFILDSFPTINNPGVSRQGFLDIASSPNYTTHADCSVITFGRAISAYSIVLSEQNFIVDAGASQFQIDMAHFFLHMGFQKSAIEIATTAQQTTFPLDRTLML